MLHKNSFFSLFLIIISFLSYLAGFLLNENSAGAGTLTGDFSNVWINLQLFINNDLITAVNLTSEPSRQYVSSRPPLIYILNSIFNPFTHTKELYIRSIFLLSFLAPLLFFICLKIKFFNSENILLALITSLIFLSPYFRTSSYWGLEENFGIIFIFLSYIFFKLFLFEKKKFKKYFYNFFTVLFSSLCIYFDQKLLIIPLICFFKIFFLKREIGIKIFTIILYILLSLPYVYFIYLWKNIIPTGDGVVREVGLDGKIYLSHFGYSLSIVSFYLFPFLFLKDNSILKEIKKFFLGNILNIIAFSFFILYLFYLLFFFDFENEAQLGKGIVHKISNFFNYNSLVRKIFILLSFLISFLILIAFLNKNVTNIVIILYFLVISIFISPIMQEYYDPIIFILVFTFLKFRIVLNYTNIYLLFFYLTFFLLSANIYYINKLI